MIPHLPGPEERTATKGQLEVIAAGLDDDYAHQVPSGMKRVDTTKPWYLMDVWVTTHTPPLLISDSIDQDLGSSRVGGITPYTRTFTKANREWYETLGFPLEGVIRHEKGHLEDPEYLLPHWVQEQNVQYRYGP